MSESVLQVLYSINGCNGFNRLFMCFYTKMFGLLLVYAFSVLCMCTIPRCLTLLLEILVILSGIVGMDISNLVPRLGPHSPCSPVGCQTIMGCVRTNLSLQCTHNDPTLLMDILDD